MKEENFHQFSIFVLIISGTVGRERKESPSAQGRKADQPAQLRAAVCVWKIRAAAKLERGSSGFQNPSQLTEIITGAMFPISSSEDSRL